MDSRIPPSTEQQRISELEAALATAQRERDACIEAARLVATGESPDLIGGLIGQHLKAALSAKDARIAELTDKLAAEMQRCDQVGNELGGENSALRAQLQEARGIWERLELLEVAVFEAALEVIEAARSEGGSTKGTAHSADAEGARNASDLGGDSREER